VNGVKSTSLDFSAILSKGNHIIEFFGADDCCDKTTTWSFEVGASGRKDFTTDNFNYFRWDPKGNPPSSETVVRLSTGELITRTPVVPSTISFKTRYFKNNAVEDLTGLKVAMAKNSTKTGYCDGSTTSMTKVSNRAFCKGGSQYEIGFYYRVTFGVGDNKTMYSFRLPTDFTYGGVSYLDGVIVKQFKDDISTKANTHTKLDFNTTLSAGMHVLEVYGAEGCCDTTTKW